MFKALLKWAVAIVALFLVFYYLDIARIKDSVLSVGLLPFLSVAGFLILANVFAGMRWCAICKGLGIPNVDYSNKIKINFAASFVSLAIPFPGGGDAFRAVAVSAVRKTEGWDPALSVLFSRVNGFSMAIILAITTTFLVSRSDNILYFYGMIFLVISLLFLIPLVSISKVLKRKSSPLFLKAWFISLLLSLLFQLTMITSRYYMGIEIGLDMTWLQYAFIGSIMFLLSPILPSFGFLGFSSVGFVSYLVSIGQSADLGASLVFSWYLSWVLAALIPGVYCFYNIDGREILGFTKSRIRHVIEYRLRRT